jgi:hypothetical protein
MVYEREAYAEEKGKDRKDEDIRNSITKAWVVQESEDTEAYESLMKVVGLRGAKG